MPRLYPFSCLRRIVLALALAAGLTAALGGPPASAVPLVLAPNASAPAESHDGDRVTIKLGGIDRQYDSFEEFVERDPGLAALLFASVFVIFLTPLLVVALIVWYKIRRNRMQNDTVLRLAERGLVAPAQAIHAVGSGRGDALAGALPLSLHATRSTARSDFRKGVLLGALGFAIVAHGFIDSGEASWLGLILLFVGIGYLVLWYFEDRQFATFDAGRPDPRDAPP
jgi:hypothetical protein